MSFLDKFTKGVGKAAEQAKFEADKLVRINRLSSEVSELATEAEKATAAIGTKVMELRAAGALQMPELDEMIQRVEALRAQVAAKQAELETVRAEKFELPPTPQAAAPTAEVAPPPPPAPSAVPGPKFCPNCGAAIEAGAKFCPSCGQKLG